MILLRHREPALGIIKKKIGKSLLMRKSPFFYRYIVVALVMSFLFGLFPGRAAWAAKARLADIVVTNTRDDLIVYFSVADCFTDDMQKAINNGVSTTFTFFVKLCEVRDWWWDKDIADLKVSHEIKYDSLKKIYEIRLSSSDDKVVYVKDFEEAKKLMSEIVGLKVTELRNLQRGNRYQISMMAELDKIRLPFYFHYVFFFLSLWDFETDWYTVDFRY
ncbi:MAG: hypothetical protein QG552_539 [Thermodesulfobacteriota bacterium]|nr:hypothetical protein [Thermodesulfobacteriota bacterium]